MDNKLSSEIFDGHKLKNYKNSFWIQYFKKKEYGDRFPWLDLLTQNILNSLGNDYGDKDNEVQVKTLFVDTRKIILNMLVSIDRQVMWIKHSRDSNNYTQNNGYDQKNVWIKYHNLVWITDNMVHKNWIWQKMGWHDERSGHGECTVMLPTFKFYNLCLEYHVEIDELYNIVEKEMVRKPVLQHRKDKEYRHRKNEKGKSVPHKTNVPLVLDSKNWTRKERRIANECKKQNKTMREICQVKLDITDEQKMALFKKQHFYNELLDTDVWVIYTNCEDNSSGEKRVRFGGRISAYYQSLPSELRKHIVISYDEGITWNETIELDYSAIHPCICYALEGVSPPDGELYDIGEVGGMDAAEFQEYMGVSVRSIVKNMILIMLNKGKQNGNSFEKYMTESIMESIFENEYKRISQEFEDDECYVDYEQLQQVVDAGLAEEIKDKMLKKHELIAHYFFNNMKCMDGKADLMNLESRLTHRIRKTFTDLNKPILSIHDSYISDKRDEELLRTTMVKVFKEEMKSIFVPDIKVIDKFGEYKLSGADLWAESEGKCGFVRRGTDICQYQLAEIVG